MSADWFERRLVPLADGRTLETYLCGDPSGQALVFHDGSPSTGLPYREMSSQAAERGLRLIGYSRPGYAGSSRREGRVVADIGSDIAELLDHLRAERCLTLGWSGGGPHALATAAVLGQRVLAAATIGSVAPFEADGLDWMAGMGAENVQEFGAALAGPAELEGFLAREGSWVATVTADDIIRGFGDLIDEVDAAALTGEYATWLAEVFRDSVSTGIWGWFDDDLAFIRPWGFDLAAIRRPVAIWQGAHDRMVPFAHGEWLARHLGSARPHLFANEGHLSLTVSSMDRVLDDLLALGGEGP